MASLNSAMLSPSHSPVPLPREKCLLTTPSVDLSLFPLPPGAAPSIKPPPGTELTATGGTVYTSNQRVVFVSKGAGAGTGAGGEGSLAAGNASVQGVRGKVSVLNTLSVPLEKLVDGRLIQVRFCIVLVFSFGRVTADRFSPRRNSPGSPQATTKPSSSLPRTSGLFPFVPSSQRHSSPVSFLFPTSFSLPHLD